MKFGTESAVRALGDLSTRTPRTDPMKLLLLTLAALLALFSVPAAAQDAQPVPNFMLVVIFTKSPGERPYPASHFQSAKECMAAAVAINEHPAKMLTERAVEMGGVAVCFAHVFKEV